MLEDVPRQLGHMRWILSSRVTVMGEFYYKQLEGLVWSLQYVAQQAGGCKITVYPPT